MEPIDPKHEAKMRAVIETLAEMFKGFGVTLLIFDYGDKGRMNYLSTANREDMIAAMKEFIARHEGRYVESEDCNARN